MGQFVRFQTTLWSLVETAQTGDRSAMDRMLLHYRPALLNFAMNQGLRESEAEDATQEALLRVFIQIASVDPKKGKFRSLLLAITRNVVYETLRKRGKASALPEEDVPEPEREEHFDRAWIENIVLLSLEDVGKDCESAGTNFHKALQMRLAGESHEAIAEKLEGNPDQVKSYIYQAREKLRRRVLAYIKEYTAEGEFEDECIYLLQFLQY